MAAWKWEPIESLIQIRMVIFDVVSSSSVAHSLPVMQRARVAIVGSLIIEIHSVIPAGVKSVRERHQAAGGMIHAC